MSDANRRVNVDLVAGSLQRPAERHILRVHLRQVTDALHIRPEPRILEVLNDTLANHHPAHTRVCYGYVLWCTGELIGAHELERARLGEKLLVPLLDGREVLQILHHIQTGRHVVWALQKVEKVLGLENHVRINPHHDVIVYATLERLLFGALQNVTAEALGARKVHDASVLLGDHNLVATAGSLHQQVRPGEQELTRVLATGHAKHNLDHLYITSRIS